MTIKEQLAELQKSMRTIVDNVKASGRDFTDAEMTDLEVKAEQAQELKGKIERSEQAKSIMDSIGGLEHNSYNPLTGEPNLTGKKGWGKKAVDSLATLASSSPQGAKSLVSGTVSVPAILSPDLVEAAPRSLLDLIPVASPRISGSARPTDGDSVGFVGRSAGDQMGNVFSFIRQSARTSNAGAVPDGAEKPTSTYTFGPVEDTYRVYANKTEDLPWRYLDDFTALIDILSVQLRDDTLAAIERDVLSGDGLDDRFTGILETSGVQVQAYTADLLTTLSAAKYKLLAHDRNLTGWAFNPLDLQALEMLRENGDNGAFLFKSRADIEGFLGGPVVTSLGLPTGRAMAADWNQAELLPVGDDALVFDGKNRTENNTFRLMFEGRYGLRVKKPFDFVSVDLIP
ncbi:phage major capsid protein [Microbacterium aquimaris]|uniref:Phage major capsid protein n=1 Tax=Microbacterium aquimaris TaxID=459816 RepID=A0ABU5N7K5_9MICO|nr:phage major capsid protein [Microbacterium aquimaris]MDZ8161991.1 phage major capsid protein [Microbacterium aquimaris]